MNAETIRSILSRHTPLQSVDYCVELWVRYHFDFILRKSRITKIGDFAVHPGKPAQITVNHDLHPYLFLMTYVHEVAHLDVHLSAGHRAEAHGAEWKTAFKRLFLPVMNEENFPTDLLEALRRHMANPKATIFSDAGLMLAFRKYDPHTAAMTFLSELPAGSIFQLRKRWFKKGETKRTRILCQEVKTKKKYWVPMDAAVKNVQLSLL